MTVHPKNHVTEYVHDFGYRNKMKIGNDEKRVVGNQRLKTDENEKEPECDFLELRPVGRFIWLNLRSQYSIHLKEL